MRKSYIFGLMLSLLSASHFAQGALISKKAPKIASDPLVSSKKEVPSYYEPEGDLLAKARVFALWFDSSTPKKWSSNPHPDAKLPIEGLFVHGFGGELAVSYSFLKNMNAELSAGVISTQAKKATVQAVNNNFGRGIPGSSKYNVYMIPINALLQFQVAPFGGLRPYVGAGGSGIYMYTQSKDFELSSQFAPVIQAGLDFVAMDDMLINLDVKKYFFTSNITFKKEFLDPNVVAIRDDLKGKMKLNPLVVSVGVGVKF